MELVVALTANTIGVTYVAENLMTVAHANTKDHHRVETAIL